MKKRTLALLLLSLTIGVAWAQKKQITISGTVISSADKEPVIAASVECRMYRLSLYRSPYRCQGELLLQSPRRSTHADHQ